MKNIISAILCYLAQATILTGGVGATPRAYNDDMPWFESGDSLKK